MEFLMKKVVVVFTLLLSVASSLLATEFIASVDFEGVTNTTSKYRIDKAVQLTPTTLITLEQLNLGSSAATWSDLEIESDSSQFQGYFISAYDGTATAGITMTGNWLLLGGFGETTVASDESKYTTATLVLDKEVNLDSNFSLSMDLAMVISTTQTGYMVIIGKDSADNELFRVICPNGDYPTDHQLSYRFATLKSDLSIENETIAILSGASGALTRDAKLKMTGTATGYELNVRNFDDTNVDTVIGSFFTGDKALSSIEFRCVASKCEWGIDNIEVKGEQAVTPVIDLQVEQKGRLVNWSLSEEIGVICYRIIDEAGKLVATVMASGKTFYQVELESSKPVRLVVVDNYGSATYIPQDGNLITTPYMLKKGWNLIAITGDYPDLSQLELLSNSKIWMWNGTYYEEVNEPMATQAIWVESDFDQEVEVTGQWSDTKIKLLPGWNLVGPTTDCYCPDGSEIIYCWNKIYEKVLKSEQVLLRGVGYWIFSE